MPFTPEPLPSGRWRGGFRHPATGRKIRKTFDYEWEAEAWAATEESKALKIITGDEPEPSTPTAPTVTIWRGPALAEYGADYIRRRSGLLAKATRNKYGAFLDGLTKPYGQTGPIGKCPMGLLKKSEVEQWMTDQLHDGVGRPTINGRLSFVRRLYRDLLAEGETPIHRDPTHGIKQLPEDQAMDKNLTPAEEVDLLRAAPDELRIAILFGLDTGLRWQEVYALRADSLAGGEHGTDYVYVTHVVERGNNELRAYPKGKRKRVVPTTERLAEAIAPLLTDRRPGQLLFPTASGTPWDYHNHRNRLWTPTLHSIGAAERVEFPTKRLRKYGPLKGQPYMQVKYTPDYGFHALRHTYGSRLAAAGVPRSQIAALMGHKDEATTARYIHAGDEGRRLALVRQVLGHDAA